MQTWICVSFLPPAFTSVIVSHVVWFYLITFGIIRCRKMLLLLALRCLSSLCSSAFIHGFVNQCSALRLWSLRPWQSQWVCCGGLDHLPAGVLWSLWRRRSCRVTNANCCPLRKESTNLRKSWKSTQEDRYVHRTHNDHSKVYNHDITAFKKKYYSHFNTYQQG